MAPVDRVEVLVLPVFRRLWLQHVCTGPASRGAAPPDWRGGATLGEKARLAAAGLQHWAAGKVDEQWHRVQTAPEGSFNSYLFKLAQLALRRVDADEAFLKALPPAARELAFRVPSSVPPRLARRRLRLLCRARAPFHEKRMWLWAAAVAPQAPLAVLPLPNVTIYYTLWRVWCHHSARRGARALGAALDAAAAEQRAALAARFRAAAAAGQVTLRPGEWPARLVEEYYGSSGGGGSGKSVGGSSNSSPSTSTSSSGKGNNADGPPSQAAAAASPQQQQPPPPAGLPPPEFAPDAALEAAIDARARVAGVAPLSEEQVQRVVTEWQQDHLLEHFRSAQRCLAKLEAEGKLR